MRTMVLLILLITLVSGCATSGMDKASDGPWRLVWSDEFDYRGLPAAEKWGYDVGGHGWGNQELQYYTRARAENARVEDSVLVIEARREAYGGNDYTSARLVTRGKASWTYGRFEIRAMIPCGRGTWPAIWMLPVAQTYGTAYWPDNGEIDIMEHVGWNPGVIHGTVHTKAYNHLLGTQRGGTIQVPTACSAFHVYAIEWEPEEIRWYVDGKQYFRFPNERLTRTDADWRHWPFDRPFYLILNIAVGGTWGGAQGVDPAAFPARMIVDYVRVYEKTHQDSGG